MNKPIGVAAVGNVLDINCWSNIPYYFFKTGKKKGIFNEAWQLNLDKFKNKRILWNTKNLILGKGKGGYQYSQSFLQHAEAQIPSSYFSSRVISFNQTFPRATSILKKGGKISYYIDTSLYNLFNESDYEISIPDWIKKEALKQELDNFQNAEKVICMGSWAKDALLDYYKLDEKKVGVILPGANIEFPDNFNFIENEGGPGIDRELVLGFVGKDWKRKGLPFLMEICNFLNNKNIKVKIIAIGNCPDELKYAKYLEYSGFVNKQTDTEKFIHILSQCDIGCLFSTTEALGISTLEFLRLGIPVAGFYHQGLKDTLMEGASFKFKLEEKPEQIAGIFESFVHDKELRHNMILKAREYSKLVTWDRCVEQWKEIL